jgi:dTDP-4-amino-4,6-dideoxygalactose transaminase
VFHYVPLHTSPAGRRFGRASGTLGTTDQVSERLLRLPLWIGMEQSTVDHITDELTRALE